MLVRILVFRAFKSSGQICFIMSPIGQGPIMDVVGALHHKRRGQPTLIEKS